MNTETGMSRWSAAKATARTLALIGIFALALERYPYSTMGTLTVASIYRSYRKGSHDAV